MFPHFIGKVPGHNSPQPTAQLIIAITPILLLPSMRFQQRLLNDVGGVDLRLKLALDLHPGQSP